MLSISMLLLVAQTLGQKLPEHQPGSRENFLNKSKSQKSGSWSLLGAGTGLVLVGLLIGNRESSSFDDAATGVILGGLGVVSALGSIPLFIASGKNKRKAANASAYFKLQKVPFKKESSFNLISYPAVCFKIKI
jgi:hypothetical protein